MKIGVKFQVHFRNYDIFLITLKILYFLTFCVSLRLKPGFHQVKAPDSDMPVFIVRVEGNRADIEVSQPSDCLLLQRDHVQSIYVGELTVGFGYDFTNEIQSPDTWKEALHHILDTYRPTQFNFHTLGSHTGIEDGHKVDLADGTSYRSFWNESKSVLSIIRYDYER